MSDAFKKIGLIGKFANAEVGDNLRRIVSFLQERQLEVCIDQGTSENIDFEIDGVEALDRTHLGEQCDLVIVVGGDGTMLNSARSLARFDVPMIGINMGHLGFLTDISWDSYEEKLEAILSGAYSVEKRLLLQAKIIRDGAEISDSIAFNDVVVHKWEEARMLQFDTSIDGNYVNTQRADGLIISTPTGSTAYALSGGGPILHPNMHAVSLVPICPHTLSQRPLVIDGDSEIIITISEEGHARAQVTCDGQINLGVTAGDKIYIKRLERKVTLLHPHDYNYFEILRAKLHWGVRLF